MLKYVIEKWIKKLRYSWSNKRIKPFKKLTYEDYEKYIPKNHNEIQNFIKHMFKRFKYKRDNICDLLDRMESPEYCWYQLIHNPPLKDDCDGFHAGLYWGLQHHFDCRLLTVIPNNILKCHTMLVIRFDNNYAVIDYNNMSDILVNPNIDKILAAVNKLHYKNLASFSSYELSIWTGSKWESDTLFF